MMWVEKNVVLAPVMRLNCSAEETKVQRQERSVIVAEYFTMQPHD